MRRHIIIAMGFTAAMAACQRQPEPPPNQPDNPLLEGLTPPPQNKPIHQPSEQQKTAPPVQLPPGLASALIVMRDGHPFVGVANLTGRVNVDASRIRIESGGDSALELRYRLPPGVPALRAATGNGTVAVVERSNPAGADHLAVVRLDSRAILGEIWQHSPKPLQLDLGNGVRLIQQPVRGAVTSGYSEAQLDVFDGSRLLTRVPLGRPTRIQTVSGSYTVFAEVSHLFTPSAADADQVEGGYILRAWIVTTN